jgi:hypothetical protein
MKTSSTFRVDHRPLRHKHRGVWGGAIVPGVIVLGFYACMLLAMWQGDAKHSATGRRLFDAEMRSQPKMRHFLESDLDVLISTTPSNSHAWINTSVMNATDAARDARIQAVYVELQSRADQLVLATTMFVVAAGLTSVVFVYMLWRRVNQLQATLQPDAGPKV